jgi:hypothetical protein
MFYTRRDFDEWVDEADHDGPPPVNLSPTPPRF